MNSSKSSKTSRQSTRVTSKSQIFPRRRTLVLEITQVLIRPSAKIEDAILENKYKFGSSLSSTSSRASRTTSRQTSTNSKSSSASSTRSRKVTSRRETPRRSQKRATLLNNSKSRSLTNTQSVPITKEIQLPNPDKLECGITLGR